MNLDDLAADYHAARQTHEKTHRATLAVLARMAEWLGRPATTADLDDVRVGRWLHARRCSVKPNTLRGEADKLLALWRYAATRGLAAAPTLTAPPAETHAPRALTRRDLARLAETAQRTRQTLRGVPGAVYWPALVWTTYQTAERIGAVRALEWPQVDTAGGWITYRAATRKRGRQETVRRVTPETAAMLRRLAEVSPRSPFGAVVGSAWYAYWAALRAEAGLAEWVTPHVLRASAASHLPTLAEAAALLGHSSPAVTAAHYRDPRVSGDAGLVDRLARPRRRGWLGWLAG